LSAYHALCLFYIQGTNIQSTFPKGKINIGSGTSQAAAHVTGVMVKLLSKYGPMDVAEMKKKIIDL